ncbi:ABC transporter substrate-binding protein [Amycolatopsis deserti]|uniref:ABC transporter substrate-binding protein n=1 Tax=Amycolatopsis deserti TaxID=185696 RepID=A0ABQ3J0P5_9PSEU|nr:ABC transporter substrate-binding protein [Amycolatopsis deserti]GHE98715.1 ABC transporter substrate-binding protein [Amycolatopsis deserti]
MSHNHQLDRRRFLRTVGAAGVVLGAGGPLLSACNTGPNDELTADANAVPAGDSATRTLQVAVSSDLPSYDPYALGGNSYPLIRNMYESLIEYDHGGQPVPVLAQEFTIAPDQASVRVLLRQGVTFHNGQPLTAQAVVDNYTIVADPKAGGLITQTVSDAAKVEAIDDSTVLFTLKGPRATKLITDILQAVPLGYPGNRGNIATTGIGTGPFKQGPRIPGQNWTLVRNDGYWGAPVKVAGLNFRIVAEPTAAITALQSRQIDVISSTPYSGIPQLRGTYRMIENPSAAGTMVIYLNAKRPPFDRQAVRQAFHRAIDRDTVVRNALFGEAKTKILPWPETSPAYDPEAAKDWGFDPDRARAEFAAAGVTSLPDPILVPSNLPQLKSTAEIVQATLAGIGVQVNVQSVTIADFLQQLTKGTNGIYVSTTGNENKYPTALAKVPFFATTANPYFPNGTPPAEYVSAVEAANTAVSDAEQKAAFKNLNAAILQTSSFITVSSHSALSYYAPNVHGLDRNIDAMPYFGNAFFSA